MYIYNFHFVRRTIEMNIEPLFQVMKLPNKAVSEQPYDHSDIMFTSTAGSE